MSTEIGILVGAVLALIAAIFVARPLLRPVASSDADESRLSDLLARREGAYQVLRDLDSDYQSAKLAEDDYRQMRVQALAQAAEIVAQLDAYQTNYTAEVVTPKDTAPPGTATKKAARRRERRTQSAFCPACGTPHEPEDAFCRKCGKALR